MGSTRDRILDGIVDLLRDARWSRLSMSAIASAVGVSRQTLYNEFGSRDELARAYVLREADRLLRTVEAAADAAGDDPAEALRAGLHAFLVEARSHPALHAIATGAGDTSILAALVTGPTSPVPAVAVARLAALMHRRLPERDEADAHAVADLVVRVGISLATEPAGDDARAVDELVRVLAPFLGAPSGDPTSTC